MTLKEKDIDVLIEEAASSEEFIINLYQKVFAGVWEAIEQLNGFPKAGEALVTYIAKSLYKKFGYSTGMHWVSVGFSMDRTLKPWEVKLCSYTKIGEKE